MNRIVVREDVVEFITEFGDLGGTTEFSIEENDVKNGKQVIVANITNPPTEVQGPYTAKIIITAIDDDNIEVEFYTDSEILAFSLEFSK